MKAAQKNILICMLMMLSTASHAGTKSDFLTNPTNLVNPSLTCDEQIKNVIQDPRWDIRFGFYQKGYGKGPVGHDVYTAARFACYGNTPAPRALKCMYDLQAAMLFKFGRGGVDLSNSIACAGGTQPKSAIACARSLHQKSIFSPIMGWSGIEAGACAKNSSPVQALECWQGLRSYFGLRNYRPSFAIACAGGKKSLDAILCLQNNSLLDKSIDEIAAKCGGLEAPASVWL